MSTKGHSRGEVATRLEVNANRIVRWVKASQQEDEGQAFRGNGKLTPEQANIRKLKAQVKQREMEKCIVKEATVFFVKETKYNTRLSPRERRPIPLT